MFLQQKFSYRKQFIPKIGCFVCLYLQHYQIMLAQIPRKPIFPEHMIVSIIKRIENDVENQVIPVSAGIYSQYKLNQKLQAIPKPIVVNYDDRIFFELADISHLPCKANSCINCGSEYGNKKYAPLQCKFCGVWNCSQCICPRKRYHPRAKQSNTPKYQICCRCDQKFLNLILNHGYVESKALLEEAIKRIRQEKHIIETECDRREQDSTVAKETVAKNKFKISSMKKDKLQINKNLAALKKEKEDLLFKIHIRQQYVGQLKQKKQKLLQHRKQQGLSNRQDNLNSQQAQQVKQADTNQPKVQKVIRTLSQRNVVSQVIYQQKKQASQQSQQTTSHTILQVAQQNLNGPQTSQVSQPQENHQQAITKKSQPQQKVQNFFNFHEWGHQKSLAQLLVSQSAPSRQQQSMKKSVEQETIVDSNIPSPESNINILGENEEDVQQSFAKKKLAQIFRKQEPPKIQMQEQQSQTQSLDAQVIQYRKKQIMRANSKIQRLSLEGDEVSPANPSQKCACHIY